MYEARTPKLRIVENQAIASGNWRVESLAVRQTLSAIRSTIGIVSGKQALYWDLTAITTLDYIGAQLLWDAWGRALPVDVKMLAGHRTLFERLAKAGTTGLAQVKKPPIRIPELIKARWAGFCSHVIDLLSLTGQFVLDFFQLLRNPAKAPWKEISASIYNAGARAIGIIALVGFLIGVVLSYLSAQQLHNFGGDPYLVNLLGIGIIREMGPMLAAILVAGRSGSSITAQIGVMRVTEELDAMQVMGMQHGFRLVMPKVIALSVVMPLLVMWTDIIALIGGMTAAQVSIGLSTSYFISRLPDAVPVANLFIGLGKGIVFGALIALVSCHFGFRIRPNTESLGQGTTSAVVAAITVVILANAVFAIAFQRVGWV